MSRDLRNSFTEIFGQIKKNKEMNETKLRRIFDKQNILESFGYDEDDVSVEANIEGKRADYHCRDEYDNVVVVWEFKKPSVTNLSDYISQLWDLYVKPLKADYGVLFNGFQIILFRRINSNYEEVFRKDVKNLTDEEVKKLQKIEKPDYSITKLKEIREYFYKFEPEEEKITLQEESSREHFYKIFRLTKGSVFENLLSRMVELFQREYETYQKSKFLTSAYDFWKEAYANEPEEVPKQWEEIMERLDLDSSKDEDLFKFMFCLETSYALFTRLILAKACEDYEFPGVEFSGFIERKVKDFSFRGEEVSRPAWAVMAKQLIERMRDQLVESIFEEDIFYWWTSAFEEIEEDIESGPYSGKSDRATVLFGEAVAKLLFAVYKFDFSKIIGDPLGNLYQRYFDKKTRKALGEFYTPQGVVDYIIDGVDYEGRQITDERLLDPACGSGTFLVTVLNKYLSEAEKKVKNGSSWSKELKKLCNEYHIVGFDIHPFATIMAQIQFMLVLLEPYKKALEEDSRFVLNRIPVFRTDSLIDERKSGKVDLESFGNGEIQSIKMPLKLPIYEEEEEGFVTIELVLPYKEAVIKHEVDLLNTEEYFKTLQALFDTVKKHAKDENYNFDKEKFKTNLKHYLENKNWSQITNFLEPYGNNLLQKIKKLKYEYGDGRLVKSIEDLLLASVLKNYVKYDFVVGNPPWGGLLLGERGALPTPEMRSLFREEYSTAYGKFDIYVLFIERGINWTKPGGSLSYITQNRFMKRKYGKKTRELLLNNTKIDLIIDFGDTDIFPDATNYPAIFKVEKENEDSTIEYIEVDPEADRLDSEEVLKRIIEGDSIFISSYSIDQNDLTNETWSPAKIVGKEILDKIQSSANMAAEDLGDVSQGCTLGGSEAENIYLLSEEEVYEHEIDSNLIRPILKGRDISRWNIVPSTKYLIYPYDIKNGELEPIDLEDYPNLREYLNQYKERLTERELDGKIITEWGKKWFELWRPRNPEILASEKIVTPRLSTENTFAYDENGTFLLDSAVGLSCSKSERKTKYFLSLLNSSLIQFYVNSKSTFVQNRYYNYSQEVIYSIPLISYSKAPENLRNQLVELVREIEKRKGLRDKVEEFPKDHLEGAKEKISKQISFEHSHSSISPQIQECQDGAYNVIIGKRKKEDPIIVNSEEKARYVKLALEGKSVKKDEKVEVLVPKSNSDVKEILEEYEEDKKKLEEMPTVEELEEEINQIVYDLYGLDEEDIEVIEDFLEKF